jgi:hypothetical protein
MMLASLHDKIIGVTPLDKPFKLTLVLISSASCASKAFRIQIWKSAVQLEGHGAPCIDFPYQVHWNTEDLFASNLSLLDSNAHNTVSRVICIMVSDSAIHSLAGAAGGIVAMSAT